MSDIHIEVLAGLYEDFNTYRRVLNYIGEKTYVGGYGFYLDPKITIVKQFQLSETYSQYKNPRKMWHFIITFSHHWKDEELLYIGNHISEIFKNDYQILFGLDTKGINPHLHFGINAFSYNPCISPLTRHKMEEYMSIVQNYFHANYPTVNISLLFQGKR